MGNFMRLRHYSKAKSISEVSGENMPVMQRANDETSRAAEVHEVCEVIEREKREIPDRNNSQKVRAGKNRLPHDVRSAERDLSDMREEAEERQF